jgi:hypothetical protein
MPLCSSLRTSSFQNLPIKSSLPLDYNNTIFVIIILSTRLSSGDKQSVRNVPSLAKTDQYRAGHDEERRNKADTVKTVLWRLRFTSRFQRAYMTAEITIRVKARFDMRGL